MKVENIGIIEFQELIRKIHFEKDKNRGKSSTLLRLGEELADIVV
ncbi:hypothetical protein IPdc08_01493 [archaeon]|nr:hypothetical protein IPdc08_01493 [archaeon]